jgi:hypothetical protein
MAMNPAVTATEDLMCGERQQPQRKPGPTLTVEKSPYHSLTQMGAIPRTCYFLAFHFFQRAF